MGYREVRDAYGVSRRTLVREDKFPKPTQLAPNRVGWLVEAVTTWVSERGKGLIAHAGSHLEDLSPEQLEDEAVALVVKAMEKWVGEPVDARDLGIQVTRRITAERFAAAEKRRSGVSVEAAVGLATRVADARDHKLPTGLPLNAIPGLKFDSGRRRRAFGLAGM